MPSTATVGDGTGIGAFQLVRAGRQRDTGRPRIPMRRGLRAAAARSRQNLREPTAPAPLHRGRMRVLAQVTPRRGDLEGGTPGLVG